MNENGFIYVLRSINTASFMRRIILIVAACAAAASAQPKGTKTNVMLLDSCAQVIAAKAVAHFPPGQTDIFVDSTKNAFLITGRLFRAAHAVESGTGRGGACNAHVMSAGVQYKKIGDQILLRTAQIQAAVDIRDSAGKALWSDALAAQVSDTIGCDDAAKLESPDIAATQAPNPCMEEASAFSSVLEPVILAAASATIVLLLFTVRSQ